METQNFVPNINIELMVGDKKQSLIWDREGVLKLVYICLKDMELITLNKNNKPICALSTQEIEKIADVICEQIFNPQSVEDIIINLANILIKESIEINKKNPKIIL
jgi:hypothetical protein